MIKCPVLHCIWSETGTVVLMIPAVYIFVVYQVDSAKLFTDAKEKFSGVLSRIGNTSAIYLPESY